MSTACKRFIRNKSPSYGKELLRKVWGIRKGKDGALVLPPDIAKANPLLAVMWARFREGCLLLNTTGACHSSVGTLQHGHMRICQGAIID